MKNNRIRSLFGFASVFCAALFFVSGAGHAEVVAYYTFDDHVRDATACLFDGTSQNLSYSTDVPSVIGSGKSVVWGDHSVSRYVSLPVIRGMGSQFTVTCWAKTSSGYSNPSGGTTLLANNVPQSAGFQWYLNSWNSDNRRLTLGNRDESLTSDSSDSVNAVFSDGVWHHLAVVRDGSSVAMYVDGLAVTMLDSTVNDDFPTDLALRIGHNFQASSDQNWCGNIDDFAIWNEALTAARIAALAAGTDSPAASLASPVRAIAYFPFDGDANDDSGLDYHANAVNLSYDTDVPSEIGSGNSLEWGDHSVSRYVEVPRLLEMNTEFSVTCWAKTPSGYSNPSGGTTLLAGSIPQSAGFQWYLNNWNLDDRRLSLGSRDAGLTSDSAASASYVFSDGQWHHLALVRKGGVVEMYVDGNAVTMLDATVNDDFPTDLALRIGHNYQASSDQNWCGNIDDFAIWNGALSANVISGLADGSDSPANHLVPSWWVGNYVDEMDGFYRYGTMVDVWLKNGSGLVSVPDYLTQAGDFPYQKKDSSVEGLFVDHWFLVRALGGWATNWVGKGEFSSGTSADEYDVAYHSGTNVLYRWDKLFGRLDPYLNAGYSSLTLVTDGVPWDFTANPEHASYGNATVPDDLDEWHDFMAEMGSQLVSKYGSATVGQFRFRVGTELRERLHFTDDTQILKFYDYTSEGLMENLPSSSRVGMWNYAGNLEMVVNGVTNDMVTFGEHCGSGVNYYSGQTGSFLDWQARSIYSHKTSTGQPNIDPFLNASDRLSQMVDIEDASGFAVPWEVHEIGILENEYELSTPEPGAYGAAWYYSWINQLYCGGFDAVQHWTLTEKIGTNSLLIGHGWVLMVLDHLRGGEFYMLDAPAVSANGTQYSACAVDCGSKKYVLLSAFNTDRTVRDTRTVTIDIPRDLMSIADTSTLRAAALTMDTAVYDVIREDLDGAGLLNSDWSSHADVVSTVSTMGGAAAKDYVALNWSTYQDCIDDSLTLGSFAGSLSQMSLTNRLSVSISAPAVMVIEIQ